MINLKKTAQMRNAYLAGELKIQNGPEGADSVPLNELLITNEELWKIAIAAKRWLKASAGQEASEREAELSDLVEALPSEG